MLNGTLHCSGWIARCACPSKRSHCALFGVGAMFRGARDQNEWWLNNQRWTRRPPRKIRSAYAYYVQANFRRIGRILGTRMPQVILRGLGQAWRNLSEDERKPYRQRNLDDRERFRTYKERWSQTFKGRLPRMRRKPKPIDAPKRSRNPYIIFTMDMWPRVKDEFPDWPQEEVVEEISKRWQKLTDDDKEEYRNRSQKDKDRYAREMREYRRLLFRQVALNRVRNLEIRLACVRKQAEIRRSLLTPEQRAHQRGRRMQPPQPALVQAVA